MIVERVEHVHILGGPVIRAYEYGRPVMFLDVENRARYTKFDYGQEPSRSDLRSLMKVVNKDISERGEELAGVYDLSRVGELLVAYNRLLARHFMNAVNTGGGETHTSLVKLGDGRVIYTVMVGNFKISGTAPYAEVSNYVAARVKETIDVANIYA